MWIVKIEIVNIALLHTISLLDRRTECTLILSEGKLIDLRMTEQLHYKPQAIVDEQQLSNSRLKKWSNFLSIALEKPAN